MKNDRITNGFIKNLKDDEIFVFGSNLAGIHGAGAARQAMSWGAEYGVGVGLQGQTYAIPTKDYRIETLPLPVIEKYINEFIAFAAKNKKYTFLVTDIGCGLAGYKPNEIAPLFRDAIYLDNVHFSKMFAEYLFKKTFI